MPRFTRVFSGEKLRKVRESRGLSRMALARLTPNVGPFTINQYEDGVTVPNANRVLELARALKCHVEDFFNAAD